MGGWSCSLKTYVYKTACMQWWIAGMGSHPRHAGALQGSTMIGRHLIEDHDVPQRGAFVLLLVLAASRARAQRVRVVQHHAVCRQQHALTPQHSAQRVVPACTQNDADG